MPFLQWDLGLLHFTRDLENQETADMVENSKADQKNEGADGEKLPAQYIVQRLAEECHRAVNQLPICKTAAPLILPALRRWST